MSEELAQAAARYTAARIALLKARDEQDEAIAIATITAERVMSERPGGAGYRWEYVQLAAQDPAVAAAKVEVQRCLVEVMEAEGELIALNGLQVMVNAEWKR